MNTKKTTTIVLLGANQNFLRGVLFFILSRVTDSVSGHRTPPKALENLYFGEYYSGWMDKYFGQGIYVF